MDDTSQGADSSEASGGGASSPPRETGQSPAPPPPNVETESVPPPPVGRTGGLPQESPPVGPSGSGGISLNSPTALPGLALVGLGVVLALSGLMPWFTLLSLDMNGFRGDMGDTSGWIAGIPVGWLLLLAGVAVAITGLLLVLTGENKVRRLAAVIAGGVSLVAAVGIVAERFKIHSSFDDAMRKTATDQISRAIASSFKLSDGVGIWIALAVSLLVLITALWALVIASQPTDSNGSA